jgi:hypothetical protein
MTARVPWWAVLSSAAAPVLLIGGWTVAAARQRAGFDPVAASISALAAVDADSRWVMTTALAGVGVCHLATASGLRPAAGPGRVLLALGGVGTLAVAAAPLPADHGQSGAHTVAATVAFGALAAWPAVSPRRQATDPGPAAEGPGWALRRPVALGASGVLLGLLGWFAGQLGGGSWLGLTERLAAGAQAVWPLVAVLSARRAQRTDRKRAD